MLPDYLGWPAGGEIDIIEYVNMQTRNSFSVHTASGCEMGRQGYSGSFMMNSELATNCDAAVTQAQVKLCSIIRL